MRCAQERNADLASSPRSDLNLLVANYLFTEGYLSAAENFSREAGLDTTRLGTAGGATYDLESIRNRMEIRRAVLKGEVETALEKVVDLDLEVSSRPWL
jgi:ribosomal protein S8